MILNQVANVRDEVLHNMRNSNIEFYLTGSRYFGNVHQDSDWDFFTSYTRETETWLLEQGFKKLDSLDDEISYKDSVTISVWRLEKGIDVQLVKSVNQKLKAQQILSLPSFRMLIFDNVVKAHRKKIWNDALVAASL
jgi:hypothetical protein